MAGIGGRVGEHGVPVTVAVPRGLRGVLGAQRGERFGVLGVVAKDGLLAGIVTMLANAAGPVMTVYLLSQRLEKKELLGVFSRYFLFVNLFKVPFSTNLGIINSASLVTNLCLLPGVIAGILLGWQILKRLPQKPFEWTLFVLTFFAAIWMVKV